MAAVVGRLVAGKLLSKASSGAMAGKLMGNGANGAMSANGAKGAMGALDGLGGSAPTIEQTSAVASLLQTNQAGKALASNRRYQGLLDSFNTMFNSPAATVIIKYIIFIIFVLFIISLLFGRAFFVRRRRSRSQQRNRCKYSSHGCKKSFGPFSIPFASSTPGGGGFMSSMDEYRNYDADNYTMVQPRKAYPLGRCDNNTYVELHGRNGLSGPKDAQNVCADMRLAPNIEWIMPMASNNPEWARLPPTLRTILEKYGTVVIPLKMDDGVMNPDCSAAYYKADPNKLRLPFLQDNGLTCSVLDIQPNTYGERFRHRDSALDDWSEVENVDCANGECGR